MYNWTAWTLLSRISSQYPSSQLPNSVHGTGCDDLHVWPHHLGRLSQIQGQLRLHWELQDSLEHLVTVCLKIQNICLKNTKKKKKKEDPSASAPMCWDCSCEPPHWVLRVSGNLVQALMHTSQALYELNYILSPTPNPHSILKSCSR